MNFIEMLPSQEKENIYYPLALLSKIKTLIIGLKV